MVANAFPLLAFHEMSQHVLGSLLGLSFSTERLSDVPTLCFVELGCGVVLQLPSLSGLRLLRFAFLCGPGACCLHPSVSVAGDCEASLSAALGVV